MKQLNKNIELFESQMYYKNEIKEFINNIVKKIIDKLKREVELDKELINSSKNIFVLN